jgi:hypothetical protein
MAKSNFVHHRNANGYYACSSSSRWTISSPGRESERFFVCLFVCLCLSGVWQLKHLHLQLMELNAQLQDAFLRIQEEKVPGSNTLGNTKTHLHLICLQTSPQHYISFV